MLPAPLQEKLLKTLAIPAGVAAPEVLVRGFFPSDREEIREAVCPACRAPVAEDWPQACSLLEGPHLHGMRFMLITELTIDEYRAILKATNLGRLACVRYSQPYIVPMYFDFSDDYLYSFATVGKKIRWRRTNPRVCVEVDDITDQFNWTTVVVGGATRN